MKGVAKIALSVALVAIVALSVVVASVAWFTNNPEVKAGKITLNSERTLIVSFGNKYDPGFHYKGQIGNVASGANAPYVYEAGAFNVNIDPSSSADKRGVIKVEFGTVTIATYVEGKRTISDVQITDLFHIETNVYAVVAEGDDTEGLDLYVKDATHNYFRAYNSETDGALTQYYRFIDPLTIASDGMLKDGNEVALFPKGDYEISFTYTFLPETAYQVWAAATQPSDYLNIYGYELDDEGDYIGVLGYTAYQAKYHYGLQRYSRSGESAPYTYTADSEGDYVRVVTGYQSVASVTKYTSDTGAGEGAADGSYIKVGDSDEYALYFRYNRVNGFPYSDDKYGDEEFTFKVNCSAEEVDYEA